MENGKRRYKFTISLQQCSSYKLQVKKGKFSLLLIFGKGSSFLKAQESSLL